MDLDKVMARWVGLKYESDGACCPRDNEYFYFTKSLDACFRWLVPKLERENLYNYIAFGYDLSCPEIATVQILFAGDKLLGESADEDPALALCLAIEKLIGGQDETN